MRKRLSMKKLLTVFIVSLFMCNCVFAIENEGRPQWSSIAYPEYSGTLQYIENTTLAKKHPIALTVSFLLLVGIPVSIVSDNNSKKIEENNYWYKRQLEFNDAVATCDLIENHDERIKCYSSVKQNETLKTTLKEQRPINYTTNTYYRY